MKSSTLTHSSRNIAQSFGRKWIDPGKQRTVRDQSLIRGQSTDWKKRNIPSFKKGKREDYRPVCLSCVLGKIMKQILLQTMLRDTENKEVSDNNQHGVTDGKSCLINFGLL